MPFFFFFVKFAAKVLQKMIVICCDLSDIWVHTKCNKINAATYNMLQNDETKWLMLQRYFSILLPKAYDIKSFIHGHFVSY